MKTSEKIYHRIFNGVGFGWEANPDCYSMYDFSAKRIQRWGYERHPLPQELVRLLVASIKGGISNLEDMMAPSLHVWTCIAVKVEGNELTTYVNPRGMDKRIGSYSFHKNLACDSKQRFPIDVKGFNKLVPFSAIPLPQIPLSHLDDSFVQFLCGSPFSDLPPQIQERMEIILPEECGIRPVSFYCTAHSNTPSTRDKNFFISLRGYFNYVKSMGVRCDSEFHLGRNRK